MDTNNSILYKNLSYEIMGAVYEVHNILGSGFLEKVYERALLEELNIRGIKAVAQKEISVFFRDKEVGHYIADIVVEGKILLELKAVGSLARFYEAQVLNYLKASGFMLGYIDQF